MRPATPIPTRVHGRRFGVEIECVLDPRAAAQALRDAGVTTEGYMGYTHDVTAGWKVVTDATVHNGCEVVSPILKGAAGIREMKRVMKALKAAGARVDRRCGLHVHHDVNDLDGETIARLVESYAYHQASIDTFLPASRRGGQWCGHFRGREVGMVCEALRRDAASLRSGATDMPVDRYRTVNVTAYAKYGTVEFRQHQGTLNGRKAAAWVSLGWSLVGAAKAASDHTAHGDVLDLAAAHGLSAPDRAYLAARREALSAA